MTFTSDRKLMAPTDVDQLFKLVWAMLDADADFFAPGGYVRGAEDYRKARNNLIDFILAHPMEFFDLISRGRSSDQRLDYVCEKNLPNGAADTSISYPAYWDAGDCRYDTARQVYHAPFTKFGIQSSPALTKLVEQANTSCETRGHSMTWGLVTDEQANGVCDNCGKEVSCRTKPAHIGGEAVEMECK